MATTSQIQIYQANDGTTKIIVQFDNEPVWLNRNQLATLFDWDVNTIGKHINNVFKEGELDKAVTVAKYATVWKEEVIDVTTDVEQYILDVIISLGHRFKSHRGTQLRT